MLAGTFTDAFSRDRMTWIKPSFGWMMHRSGWGRKPGQEHVLAIEITRSGWEWALGHSHCAPRAYDSQEADLATSQVPAERVYPVAPALARWIGADADGQPTRAAASERLP